MSLNDPEWADFVKKDEAEYFKGTRAVLLDTAHHDVPERHIIGGTLLAPNLVRSVGSPSVGRSPAVAREDHVHGFDLNSFVWAAYTPTVTQPGTVSASSAVCHYVRFGTITIAQGYLGFSGTGTAGNPVTIGLPVTADGPANLQSIGSAIAYDASANLFYTGVCTLSGSTIFVLEVHGGLGNSYGAQPSIGLASGDQIRFHLCYRSVP
jgi:hypothetical protein